MYDNWKATHRLQSLLNGETAWDAADPSIQSWAQFYVYKAAEGIALTPTKEARQASLGKLPGFIRPRVEAELLRIWPLVRGR